MGLGREGPRGSHAEQPAGDGEQPDQERDNRAHATQQLHSALLPPTSAAVYTDISRTLPPKCTTLSVCLHRASPGRSPLTMLQCEERWPSDSAIFCVLD